MSINKNLKIWRNQRTCRNTRLWCVFAKALFPQTCNLQLWCLPVSQNISDTEWLWKSNGSVENTRKPSSLSRYSQNVLILSQNTAHIPKKYKKTLLKKSSCCLVDIKLLQSSINDCYTMCSFRQIRHLPKTMLGVISFRRLIWMNYN